VSDPASDVDAANDLGAAPGAREDDGGLYRVLRREERFRGAVFSVVSDELVMPGGVQAVRDYTRHPGAVGVVALDDEGRVVLVRQYRHPVGEYLWELPAGLADMTGETAVGTAVRELAEEADLTADRWDLLVDLHPSPGYSDEFIRVFLARDLTPVLAHERHRREHEEADMTVSLVDLDEAVAMVFRGEITNAAAVAGVLAAARARDQAWTPLRPASD
jgi:ADP-ribose pyrophosphatase